MKKDGYVWKLLKQIEEKELYIDWARDDKPNRIVEKSGKSLRMKFLKVSDKRVALKLNLNFKMDEDALEEITEILRFVLKNVEKDSLEFYYREFPVEVSAYLSKHPLFPEEKIGGVS